MDAMDKVTSCEILKKEASSDDEKERKKDARNENNIKLYS